MSTNSRVGNTKQVGKRAWLLGPWLLPILGLPVVAAGVAVTAVGYREARAEWALRHANNAPLSPDAASGNQWLSNALSSLTSQEGSALWSKVFFLLDRTENSPIEQLPWVGNEPLPPLPNSDQKWEAEEQAAKYLKDKRAVIELIYQACTAATPVWQPIAFDGFSTLLPELNSVRTVAALLQLEAEHALFHQDSQRAMAALEGMRKTAESIDWQIFVVADLTHFALQHKYLTTIQRSLHSDVWTVQQLKQLAQQLSQPYSIEERWQRAIRGEQAMVESYLDSEQDLVAMMRLFKYPSAKLQVLNQYAQLQMLAEPTQGLFSDRGFEKQFVSNEALIGGGRVLTGMYLLATHAYAKSLENAEQLRKLTRLAVELKGFYVEHQRWPAALTQLSEQGLTADDWTITGAGDIGYSVEQENAYVWGLGQDERSISPVRPTFDSESNQDASHSVTVPAL